MVSPLTVRLGTTFLLANLTVNPSEWKYGPEIVYDAMIESEGPTLYDHPLPWVSQVIEDEKWVKYNTTMKLKCRPKTRETIICHFDNPRMVISSIEQDGSSRIINDSKAYNDKNSSNPDFFFEYNMDTDIEDEEKTYTASSSISPERLNLAKALMDTLRVPRFLIKLRWNNGVYSDFRVSSIGGTGCPTYYGTASTKIDRNLMDRENKKPYDIKINGSSIKISNNESFEIYSSQKGFYYVCQSNNPSPISPGYKFYRVRSHSWMNITQKDFRVYKTMNFQVTSSRTSLFTVSEKVSLRLDDIVPASGPLPKIHDPMTYDIPSTDSYHSYTAKRYLFPKEGKNLYF